MRRLALATCFLAASSAPAQAADTWTYASSDHFEVYTTGGARTAREALIYFDRVHAFFTEFMRLAPPTSAPTRLVVFSGDRQFEPYRPSQAAVAFYQPGPDRDYIVMQSLDESAYPIVVHEYVHLVIRHSGGTLPLWLNEGLAEFFSTLEPEGNRMSVGRVPPGRRQDMTQGVALMELDELFGVTHSSPEYRSRSHAGVFYSESWALTHMLMTDDRYRARFDPFLKLVSSGMPSAEAMMTAYGKDAASVGRDLTSYVRQGNYLYFLANYRNPPSQRDLPTRRVETFEADLVTANLLANTRDREDAARAIYERLAGERPDDLQLLEARAYFEMRRGRARDALPYLARAVDQGSTNPSVYRDYAMLEPGRAEALLSRAVALAPEDADVLVRYATVLLGQARHAETVAVLGGLTSVPQELAFQVFQLLAHAYVRLNRLEGAKAAAARAVTYAGDANEAAYAARLVKSVDDFAAARAAAAARAKGGAVAAADAAPPDLAATPFAPGNDGRTDSPAIDVDGRMTSLVCGTGPPVVELTTTSGVMRFVIDTPDGISVIGVEGSSTVDLQCGPQDVPIRVGYQPLIDAGGKVDGRVRVLDYRRR